MMKKILFILPPFTGHINPTLPIAIALHQKGHDVKILGYAELITQSLPSTHHHLIHPLTHDLSKERFHQIAKEQSKRGLNAFQFLWADVLLPLAEHSCDEVLEVIQGFRPDLCVIDQQMLSGVLACLRSNTPWISTASTSGMLVGALDILPQVKSWLDERLLDLLTTFNLSKEHLPSLFYSHLGVLVFSSKTLTITAFPHMKVEPFFHFIGLSTGQRQTIPFAFERLNAERKKILVSLGTLNADHGERFFSTVVEAFEHELSYDIIVVCPENLLPCWPSHFIVQKRIPQLDLLKLVDLVICHGGHNTVCESLSEGIPLMIAPIKDDQPIVAEQVQAVGAGIRVKFARIKAKEMREVAHELMSDEKYRLAAKSIGDELRQHNAVFEAVRLIEMWCIKS
jgi:MGT family glycosyltransferase